MQKKQSKYKRLKIIVEKRNSQWSIDLTDLNELSGFSSQYRYILVCVDVHTRYAFVKLLKTKTAKNVANKFEELLVHGVPKTIQSDEGTEFAIIRKALAKKYGFKVFHTYNRETKAVHAERFIQTLKQSIRRVLTVLGDKRRYIQYLPTIVERYNEAPHRGIFYCKLVDLYVHQKIPNFYMLAAM